MEELLDEAEPGGGLVGGTPVHPVDAVLHWTSRWSGVREVLDETPQRNK
jgi:hypothetical protein